MKDKIHPKYDMCIIKCTCGNIIETKSTKKEIHIEICSKCHPYFTGTQKLVDSAGRIEKYRKKYSKKTEK